MRGDTIFNTAASFVTNTNLQHYSGEASLSYLSQLCALMWQQFVSAATGIAALAALARGLAGRKDLGNFFVDLQRASFLVLLPVALVVATLMVLGGMPMTFQGAAKAMTLEGVEQVIARGPGGGLRRDQATRHQWRRLLRAQQHASVREPDTSGPTRSPPSRIILIPMACVWMFGRILGRMRHAAVVFCVMLALMLTRIMLAVAFETTPTRGIRRRSRSSKMSATWRARNCASAPAAGPTWAVITTSTSNGSVDAMHDSLNPLTGLMPMIGMWLNEDFGGVGVGMINMFLYIIVAVFIAGMMVGRTPEYLGWRVELREVKFAMLALLAHGFFILVGTAIFAATPWGTDDAQQRRPARIQRDTLRVQLGKRQ